MNKFSLFFGVTKRAIKISLAQKTGKAILPLTKFYSWPTRDAWEDMRLFLKTQKWISPVEAISLLNTFTQVINYWEGGDPNVSKDVLNIKEKFISSTHTNLVFWGVKKKGKRMGFF
jgi:hypothetical protein